MSGLPWNWETKAADFIKPGDAVCRLEPESTAKIPYPDESFQVVLCRGWLPDYAEVRRILKPGGFFLLECPGDSDCRELAEFLLPGSRPAGDLNLENQLPLLQAAGFRVMYRDQARPVKRFEDLDGLLGYIAQRPENFPGFSRERCADRLAALEQSGALAATEHLFLLIGKKQ